MTAVFSGATEYLGNCGIGPVKLSAALRREELHRGVPGRPPRSARKDHGISSTDVHTYIFEWRYGSDSPTLHRVRQKNERFHRVESVYGSFSRSFSLPENVDAAGIKCESKDGVLTVHIPKKQMEKHKPLEIKVQ